MTREFSIAVKALSFRTPLGVRNLLFFMLLLLTYERLLAQAPPPSHIIPSPPSFHFPEDQKFVYSVQWHMLNAGTTTILITHSESAEHLHSTADTSGMTNKIYAVHDTFDVQIDPHTFCTQTVTRHAEEGTRRLDRKVRFDYQAGKSQVDDFDLKAGKGKHSEVDIPPCVTDVVSAFFYVSSLGLAPGFSETFPVNDGGKTSDVKIDVEERTRIKVPLGEFQTLRAKAEPITGPLKGKGVLWVWFTDDARHIPVQMKSKLGFATLLFQLQRIDMQTH
jgi:Protein of unknown function (DUF3108)